MNLNFSTTDPDTSWKMHEDAWYALHAFGCFQFSTHVIQTKNAKACLLQLGDLSLALAARSQKYMIVHARICMQYVGTCVFKC